MIENAVISRWMSTDPYGQFHSPYLGMGNNPVSSIDPYGGWEGDQPDEERGWLREVKIYAKDIKNAAHSTFSHIRNQFT